MIANLVPLSSSLTFAFSRLTIRRKLDRPEGEDPILTRTIKVFQGQKIPVAQVTLCLSAHCSLRYSHVCQVTSFSVLEDLSQLAVGELKLSVLRVSLVVLACKLKLPCCVLALLCCLLPRRVGERSCAIIRRQFAAQLPLAAAPGARTLRHW